MRKIVRGHAVAALVFGLIESAVGVAHKSSRIDSAIAKLTEVAETLFGTIRAKEKHLEFDAESSREKQSRGDQTDCLAAGVWVLPGRGGFEGDGDLDMCLATEVSGRVSFRFEGLSWIRRQ